MEKYHHFFKNLKEFLDKAEIHKRRGNNDFNPYLEMWSETNEVKLHSSLICGFLDPKNNHYQGDVFLESFLECVGLKGWFGDTQAASVHREYSNIDIYITNGVKHIIVENKIWAGDQHKQIERYIETITNEHDLDSEDSESSEIESQSPQGENIAYDNIAVLYLAPHKREPSESSLGKWQIQGDYLTDSKNNQVLFQTISYKDEILKWLDSAREKVGCITSLNTALLFYKDVVQIITNTKENTMSIEKFLMQGNMEKNMEIALEVLEKKDEILKAQLEVIKQAFYKQYCEGDKEYQLLPENDGLHIYGLHIYHKDFNDNAIKFYISVWLDLKSRQDNVCYEVCLYGYQKDKIKEIYLILKKDILRTDDKEFNLECLKNNYYHLAFKDGDIPALTCFTKEVFFEFFESVREKAYKFNRKIKQDLESENSKLAQFIEHNE